MWKVASLGLRPIGPAAIVLATCVQVAGQVRTGGQVVPVDLVSPVYPPIAVSARVSGDVTVVVTGVVLVVGTLLVCPTGGYARQVHRLPSGSAVSPRPEESTLKLKQDAESGDVEAQLLLGMRYLQNRRDAPDPGWVGPDPVRAAKWFRMAAEQGHPLGVMRIRTAYYLGQGVHRDGVEVQKWGIIGAALASTDKEKEAFRATSMVFAEEMHLTPEQRADADRRARDWLEAFNKRKK